MLCLFVFFFFFLIGKKIMWVCIKWLSICFGYFSDDGSWSS